MDATFDPFSSHGGGARAKVILLGETGFLTEARINQVSSLHIEHVSPAGLLRREISRRPELAHAKSVADEASLLARLRRWCFARKPDAGFLLTDFPATLLQARVFDEWLEARGESLDAVIAGPGASAPVVEHYLTLGLLFEEAGLSAR
jgi:adenylate kinase